MKMRAQAHTKKFEELTTWGQVPCWELYVSGIHRACINLEDPVNDRNEPHQGIRSQAVSSSNFFVGAWALIFFLFWKNLTCTRNPVKVCNVLNFESKQVKNSELSFKLL